MTIRLVIFRGLKNVSSENLCLSTEREDTNSAENCFLTLRKTGFFIMNLGKRYAESGVLIETLHRSIVLSDTLFFCCKFSLITKVY